MKADTVDLAAVFGQAIHYVVPLYQRPYVWTRDQQWEPLWEDVRAVADRQLDASPTNDAIPHFLGAVVLEQVLHQVGMIGDRTVIDGQQRLTTLQVLIAAARSVAVERSLDGPRRMFEKLLLNDDFLTRQAGDEYKVFPTQRDWTAFREVMSGGIVASTGGHRLHGAYRFFRGAILEWASTGAGDLEFARRLEGLSTAIWKRLVLVTIDLDPGDNAQVIFETLNARGTPLLAGDLIKNHLFQLATLQGEPIDQLYEQYWKRLDSDWWREDVQQGRLTRPRLDIFLNQWLAMSTGREVVTHLLFPEFKRYLAANDKRSRDVLGDLGRYAGVYEAWEHEPRNTRLGLFLDRLRTMEVTTAYPALLWLLGPEGIGDEQEKETALDAIESWLVRRMLTSQTTSNYNYVFLAMLNSVRDAAVLRSSRPLGSDVRDYLLALSAENQQWPTAEAVRTALKTLPAYTAFSRSRLRMVLTALEHGMRSGLTEQIVLPDGLTIEHVLPQEWSKHWPLPDGADPVQARLDREAAKHRIGNLTLVTGKLNPKMSNGPWLEKRDALRSYSVLLISSDLRDADTWDARAIEDRGDRLAEVAVRVWSRPHDFPVWTSGRIGSGEPAAVGNRAGRPDPQDPAAFAAVLNLADQVGVGDELRRIIEVTREVGLDSRPDAYGVMVTPPANGSIRLFSVWPQSDEGGSFRLHKVPSAFAQWLPGVAVLDVQRAIGESDEAGLLLASETETFLEVMRQLVPAQALRGAFEERRAAMFALGIQGLDRIPETVLRLIDHRSSGTPEVALRFAASARLLDGVVLRPQQSKADPAYFQVRHPKFSQVVAYAHPRPGEVRVEYRLPTSHPTYGAAIARDGFYGIVLMASDDAGLAIAEQLLRDALARRD